MDASAGKPPSTAPEKPLSISLHPSLSFPKRARTSSPTSSFLCSDSDDDSDTEVSNALNKLSDSEAANKRPGQDAERAASDLERRYLRHRRARRNYRPKKRQRVSPSLSDPSVNAQREISLLTREQQQQKGIDSPVKMDIEPGLPLLPPPKPLPDAPRINGRADPVSPTRRKRPRPQSLWHQLSEAQKRLHSKLHADPRFVAKTRPLDCLEHLRSSIFVTLFPDGYVRHDLTGHNIEQNADLPAESSEFSASARHTPASPKHFSLASQSTNIAQLPRHPYDRFSREFLQCLDLGLIPPPEDLPEPNQRHYYDGCLVAEIYDLRLPNMAGGGKIQADARSKIILRPDMATLYHDIELITQNLDRSVSRLVEDRLVQATAQPLSLDPRPQLTSFQRNAGVHTNIHPLNIIRAPKRKNLVRPPGPPVVPSLSTAALLLISGASQHQTLQQQCALKLRALTTENGLVKPLLIGPPSSTSGSAVRSKSESSPSLKEQLPKQSQKLNGQALPLQAASSTKRPRRFMLPSAQIINQAGRLNKDSRFGGSTLSTRNQRQQSQQVSLQSHERLRTIRLVLPDRQLALELQEAQAQAHAAASLGGSAAERAKTLRNQALQKVNKAGRPVFVAEMLRQPDRTVEVVIVRGAYGDKNRDFSRIVVSNEEEGHLALDQFKSITKKEGYFCAHDLSAANLLALQQQQAAAARASMRQATVAAATAQVRPAPPGTGQVATQAHVQMSRGTPAMNSTVLPAGISAQQLQQAKNQTALMAQREQQQRQQQQQQQIQQQQLQQQQQRQILRQQMQRQQQFQQIHQSKQQLQHIQQQQHQATIARAREQIQQLHKNAANQQQMVGLISGGRGAQVVSKGIATLGTTVQIPRPPSGSAGVTANGLGSMGNAVGLGHSQVYPPAHLQHLQQLRTQPMRVEQQRNMMVAGNPAAGTFARQAGVPGNALTPQQLQSQAIAAAMGSAGLGAMRQAGAGRGVPTTTIGGADGLNHARVPPQFKHRENVESQARLAKR